MYAITGITGNIGGEVARTLLAARQPLRAVVRDARKGEPWAQRRCEVAQADINDVSALTSAFKGAEGVFVLVPPNFVPSDDFREARATATTLRSTPPWSSRIPVDYWRAGDPSEPAHAAHHHRTGA
jgi:NAD(P)H dehydrogenase (quinone)